MVGKNEISKYNLCILTFTVTLDEICLKPRVWCMKKIYVIIFMSFVYKNCIKKKLWWKGVASSYTEMLTIYVEFIICIFIIGIKKINKYKNQDHQSIDIRYW